MKLLVLCLSLITFGFSFKLPNADLELSNLNFGDDVAAGDNPFDYYSLGELYLRPLVKNRTYSRNIFRKVLEFVRGLVPSLNVDPDIVEDGHLSPVELMKKYKYPSQSHLVGTEDGYILQVDRIPNPDKPVVFLQHGIMDTSASFLLTGPGRALGYLLYDAGYDVWLGNSRGNRYSRIKGKYNPDARNGKYWDFTFHEIGIYDLPACIDYILDKTNCSKLNFIGHSQGATSFMVMASERPEYNSKIRQMHAMAPCVFMDHVYNPGVRFLANFLQSMPINEGVMGILGVHEIRVNNEVLISIANAACFIEGISKIFCKNLPLLLTSVKSYHVNETRYPSFYGHTPGGCSIKQFAHYAQLIHAGEFRKLDRGETKNLEVYGNGTPPRYNLTSVTCPIYIHYANRDDLALPYDAAKLSKMLKNVLGVRRVPSVMFNHMDFMWAEDGPKQVYNFIISKLDKVNQNLPRC